VSNATGIALATVVAFVNRLEERGNDAANRGDIRGSVAGFSPVEYAAALDIPVEEAKALYAGLAHTDIGWVADGVIADFQDRNPDQEDPTAADRQKRQRSRLRIQKRLDELELKGKLTRRQHVEFQARMAGLDHDGLIQLQADIEDTIQNVTHDSRLSQRDSVTVTPDQKDQNKNKVVSLVTPAVASRNDVGLAREEKDLEGNASPIPSWSKEGAAQFVLQRMGGSLETAMQRVLRWSEQIGDQALFEVLQGAKDRHGTAFHMEVADRIRRLGGSPIPPNRG
jgi:hypothetical protein